MFKRYRVGIPNGGRASRGAADALRRSGYKVEESRSLVHDQPALGIEIVLANSRDLPALLDSRVCDLVITGDDYVAESGVRAEALVDLDLWQSQLCLLTPDPPTELRCPVVASQYPVLSTRWLMSRYPGATVTRVTGAAELYPRLGLADAAIDVVETGETAGQNFLSVRDIVMSTGVSLYRRRDHISLPGPLGQLVETLLETLRSTTSEKR